MRAGGALGTVVAAGSAAAWQRGRSLPPGSPQQPTNTPSGTPAPAASPVPPSETPATQEVERIDPADVIAGASVTDLHAWLEAGSFTVVELVSACLARIEDLDGGPVNLRAVIETNPDALEIAAGLDRERAAGGARGSLHGIPVLLKDVIATEDGMATTSGSLAMVNNRVDQDSAVARRLREAGAVLLGKTNLTEWSNFMGSAGVSGFSARGGQAVNPYHLDYSPSGSSSGSAIGVSAGYAPLAIGSETNGSIIAPAATCGVVGLKPTVGLVSRAGVIGISFTQDSPGPIGRSVADVALALNVLAGPDDDDPALDVAPDIFPERVPGADDDEIPDYVAGLDAGGLEGARVGICRSLFDFDPRVDQRVLELVPILEGAGATVIDDVFIDSMSEMLNGYLVLLTEFAWGLAKYLETYTPDGPITSIQDIVAFNYQHADQELAVNDQSGLEDALVAASVEDPGYIETRTYNLQLARQDGIDAVMDRLNLDVLIAPAASVPPLLGGGEDEVTGSSAYLPSLAGYPSITLPIGLYRGLPIGVHMFGRAYSEQSLLRYAYALEQALPRRAAPTFIERGEPLPSELFGTSDGT